MGERQGAAGPDYGLTAHEEPRNAGEPAVVGRALQFPASVCGADVSTAICLARLKVFTELGHIAIGLEKRRSGRRSGKTLLKKQNCN
jgi:hypothetical protein